MSVQLERQVRRMPSTKGYRSYHGKGGAGRIVLIVLLCLILLPVTNLIGEAFNLKTCIGKSLYGILGTILGINVLRITFYHNVLDFSIAV